MLRVDNVSVFTVTLKQSGRVFPVDENQTVLEAAQRAGIALPYSCRAGVCGSCRATLLEGHCDYPRNPPVALAGTRASQAILLCQAVPRSDLLIEAREIASIEDIARRQLDVVVTEKRRLAPDVIGLHLQPSPGETPLVWLPGQYLDVVLAEGKHRPFSIANHPRGDGMIELHIRHVTGGGFTSWVDEGLAVGDALRIEAPLGTFVPREDSERPIIFMAGGTGFAPVKSVVEHFIALGSRRAIDVYWGARSVGDLYQRDLAESWTRQAANLRFHPVVSEATHAGDVRVGLVHEAVLEDHPDLSGFDVYMAGPPAMVDTARMLFTEAGAPEERLYFDSFEYAPDVLAAILASRAGVIELG